MRPLRNLALGVLLLLVAVVLALGGAAIAYGATPQQRTDAVAAWMQGVLHVPVPSRPTVVTRLMASENSAAEATSDGTIRLLPEYAGMGPAAIYVRTHELSHRPANAACWGEPGSPERATEEGIADAITRDLIPAALARFAPRRWFISVEVGDYRREVAGVRFAVRALTGGRGWGRAERLALRRLWGADCAGRTAMLARAGGA